MASAMPAPMSSAATHTLKASLPAASHQPPSHSSAASVGRAESTVMEKRAEKPSRAYHSLSTARYAASAAW